MKKPEVKKLLKTAHAVFNAESGSYGIMRGYLSIRIPDSYDSRGKEFLCVQCQSNDLFHYESSVTQEEAKNPFRWIPGYSRFYGLSVQTEVNFDLSGSEYKDPERAKSFFAVIREVIEDKNLGYVSDCTLTQVIRALEVLGCGLSDITVDRKPYIDWRISRTDYVNSKKAASSQEVSA